MELAGKGLEHFSTEKVHDQNNLEKNIPKLKMRM
jgi:hypothetical protein